MSSIEDVSRRYAGYLRATIPEAISPHDDMFVPGIEGNMDHYMSVGRSAVDIIVNALVATENPAIGRILDLPCGGGRVTRHLRALFPESEIFVSDLDKRKERFVLSEMGAKQAESNPDFSDPPARQYDLIFVGSLVTHLDDARFRRAVDWFIQALAPNGLLVLTTHGRRHDYMELNVMHYIDPKRWKVARADYEKAGFGYAEYPDIPSYGLSICDPSWLMKLVEKAPGTRIMGFQEAAWDYHQDVLVVQKFDLARRYFFEPS